MRGVPASSKLSRLIGNAYDTALRPQSWAGYLQDLVAAFGCSQCIMVQIDDRRTTRERIVTVGIDTSLIAEWRECKEHIDVWYQRVFDVPEEGAYRGTQLVPRQVLRRSGFHSDILRQSDVEFCMGGIPENNRLARTVIATYNSAHTGDFTSDQQHAFAIVMPHVRRAFEIERRLHAQAEERTSAIAAIERSPYGVLVVDHRGQSMLTNGNAERILRRGDGITIRYGSLKLFDFGCQARCDRLIRECIHRDQWSGRPLGGFTKVIRPSGQPPYHLLISPLIEESDEPALPGGVCLILIHDPAEGRTLPADYLMQVYGLSAAEARLCTVLFAHDSLPTALQELEITRNTAKTQLAQIYAKVGVRSQSQLLRQLALGFHSAG